jgi:hypothetical protein
MSWPTRGHSAPVDELALRLAVIGDGLLLIPDGDENCELHVVHAGRARCLGRGMCTVAALRVLDELDLRRERRGAAVI